MSFFSFKKLYCCSRWFNLSLIFLYRSSMWMHHLAFIIWTIFGAQRNHHGIRCLLTHRSFSSTFVTLAGISRSQKISWTCTKRLPFLFSINILTKRQKNEKYSILFSSCYFFFQNWLKSLSVTQFLRSLKTAIDLITTIQDPFCWKNLLSFEFYFVQLNKSRAVFIILIILFYQPWASQ